MKKVLYPRGLFEAAKALPSRLPYQRQKVLPEILPFHEGHLCTPREDWSKDRSLRDT